MAPRTAPGALPASRGRDRLPLGRRDVLGFVVGRSRRVERDRHLARLHPLQDDDHDGRHGDGHQGADQPPDGGTDEQADEDHEGRDADRAAHDDGHQQVALDELDDQVDDDHGHEQVRPQGGRDEDGRDGTQRRTDQGNELGDARDEPEQEGRRQPEQPVRAAGRDGHAAHEHELAAHPTAQAELDVVPRVASAGSPLERQEGRRVAL